jgi:hypothetical protein
VLKEMGLIAMHCASLNLVEEVVGVEDEAAWELRDKSNPRSLFDREVAEVERMIRGRRKSKCFVHDEWTEWLNDLEADGASLKELDDAFAHVEALDQYDENGAVITMSSHERTSICGRVDPEITADDLPMEARHLIEEMRRAYASGARSGRFGERSTPNWIASFQSPAGPPSVDDSSPVPTPSGNASPVSPSNRYSKSSPPTAI